METLLYSYFICYLFTLQYEMGRHLTPKLPFYIQYIRSVQITWYVHSEVLSWVAKYMLWIPL